MITFLSPILLYLLLALPLIWYLLRVMPPAPKRLFFPATRLLIGLTPEDMTPSKTPWWILLLRLLMAALIIIALAKPIMNITNTMGSTHGAIRILLDNSWASAQTWNMQQAEAQNIIAQAGREKRDIFLLTSAPSIGESKPLATQALSESKALSILRGLSPLPWPADYSAINQILKTSTDKKPKHTIWLSHGLNEGNLSSLANSLIIEGGLDIIIPKAENLPLLLRSAKTQNKKIDKNKSSSGVSIAVEAPPNISQGLNLTLNAQGQNGQIIDVQSVTLKGNSTPQTVNFDVAEALKNNIAQFKINERKGAGSIFLLDDLSKKRDIGIAATVEKSETTPLINEDYYIKRALEPYANITLGSISELISKNLPMIILIDIAAMPTDILNSLEKWVKSGGLLLRFSGPNMANATGKEFLLPVNLRSGGRSLSGAMTWEKPQKIAPFSEQSPFFGLDIPQDLTIKQQILAEPSQDLTNKIWAQLNDGTPLITASPLEKGLVVLIHTSAGPQWSDFALSGLYVNILRRISTLSSGNYSKILHNNNSSLDPLLMMDGFGNLLPPDPSIMPLPAKNIETAIPSSINPPGIYGHGNMQYALNLGANLKPLKDISDLPDKVKTRHYEGIYEIDLMPFLLMIAVFLFFIDWFIMILIAGNIKLLRWRKIIALLFLLIIFPCGKSYADTQSDIHYSSGLFLAYIKTGDFEIDNLSQKGIENLSSALKQRTSVEPDGVIGLNPEIDNLAFFPLIYWPIGNSQKNISDTALKNLQEYLDHGGTILFDTRDQNQSTTGLSSNSGTDNLRRLIGTLNLPPLSPITKDHVLKRSFYLLDRFPGRLEKGVIWIEQDGNNGRDGVSPVIVGSNDWASAWATYSERTNRYNPTLKNSQNELAIRFGINLVMYALTGNYKADQVHIPYILDRLGK